MKEAIEEFRDRVGNAIDSVEFVKKALDTQVPGPDCARNASLSLRRIVRTLDAKSPTLVSGLKQAAPVLHANKQTCWKCDQMERAARIHEYGPPEALKIEPIETPIPGPGQALIWHTAIGLNFVEVYFRRGTFPVPAFPAVLGN